MCLAEKTVVMKKTAMIFISRFNILFLSQDIKICKRVYLLTDKDLRVYSFSIGKVYDLLSDNDR